MDETGMPSPKRQSWGALISIIVIVLMIVIGAYYAWEKRIAEQNQYKIPSSAPAQ
jgi:NADH:ubiquinone oxidoreductase subunit 3 (subunit A)